MRALTLASLLLVLVACGGRQPRVTAVAAEQSLSGRESALFAQQSFGLSGRLGISNGKDAGSGQFRWRQEGPHFDFQLTVTVTGDRVRLTGQPGKVRLIDARGQSIEGFDAEQLLLERTGWRVPVAQLGYWVRAMRAPGGTAQTRFASDGRLAELRQDGWTIQYRNWTEQSPVLPLMLVASRGSERVRVKVRDWQQP